MDKVEKVVRERDAALLSLDAGRILAYMDRYSDPQVTRWLRRELRHRPVVFWGSVHKARCQVTTFPETVYRESAQWLTAHGLSVPPRK